MPSHMDVKLLNFTPSLQDLQSLATPTHLIVSGFLRKSRTFEIYRRAMTQLGIEASYLPYEIPRLGHLPNSKGLSVLLEFFRSQDLLQTLVISDPYKQVVLPMLDALEPRAERAGAVNLVSKRHGRTLGDNIDGEAFLLGAEAELEAEFRYQRVTFLGCGGVSSAVAVKLGPQLGKAALVDTIEEKAQNLRSKLLSVNPRIEVQILGRPLCLDLRDFEVLYNGTGLGKHGTDSKSLRLTPLSEEDLLPGSGLAIDANYTPWSTSFLQTLAGRGFQTLNGFSHMVAFVTLHLSKISATDQPYPFIRAIAENCLQKESA